VLQIDLERTALVRQVTLRILKLLIVIPAVRSVNPVPKT